MCGDQARYDLSVRPGHRYGPVANKRKAQMPCIRINASGYGTPGEVVAVEDGLVVWSGPIEAIAEAGNFDELFCHDEDEARLAAQSYPQAS